MATSGAEAWKKYYAGFGDRDTIVKKESNLYDITSANKQIGILPAGSKVLVLATKTFDSKPIITYKLGLKVYKHRIKFADLQKPELKSSNNSPLTSKTIGNKVLTPDGLGLSGKTIKKEYYLSTVKLAINNCNTISPIIKDILNELLIKSINTSSTLTLNIKSISEKDVNIIGKDFGEVTGAWWFLNNYDTDVNAIEFPARSNEPLIDYYAIRKNGLKIKVSAKSNAGAAPALNPVDKAISMIKLNSNEIEIAKFINAIVTNTGVESIVVASKLYSSVAYKEVQRIIGVNNITVEEIESYLLKYTDPKELHQYLTSKLYSKIGRSVPLNSIENIFASKIKRSGIILSPMAYALVDEVNKNKEYRIFLSKVCKLLNIEQLYINIRQSGLNMKYILKGFRDNTFSFEYHSNAKTPGLNKIGFKMDI